MEHPLSVFTHCPRCGSSVFSVHDERSKKCAECGFVYYHNASSAVAAFIVDGAGRMLVCRRRLDPARGTLDLPGGFVDPGETLEEAVRREVLEETGCRVRVERYLFSLSNTYRYSSFDVHTCDAFFLCSMERGVPEASDDAEAVAWMSVGEVEAERFGLQSVSRAVARFQELRQKEGKE